MMESRTIRQEDLKTEAKKLGRLVSISWMDEELYYHFYGTRLVAVRFKPKDKKAESLVSLFPNAGVMERELHDFFGIEFQGNDRLHEKLFISDDTTGPVREV